MKAIVFGGTGFIGSHVVEQLQLAGHQVTAAVRDTSNTAFLESLGVHLVRIDITNTAEIRKTIAGHEAVYNCTADAKLHSDIRMDAPVEIKLTRTLIEAAAAQGASRFIQLSTIIIYDFDSNEPFDESYISKPVYLIQRLAIERRNETSDSYWTTFAHPYRISLSKRESLNNTKNQIVRVFVHAKSFSVSYPTPSFVRR